MVFFVLVALISLVALIALVVGRDACHRIGRRNIRAIEQDNYTFDIISRSA